MIFKVTEKLFEIIEKYNINIVNGIFIVFTLIIVVFGCLINLVEPLLPAFIKQSYRYGKFSYKGPEHKFVSKMEVPKSWFKHFYVFALSWYVLALYFVFKGIITHSIAPEYVLKFLDFMAGGAANRKVLVDSNSALVASILMTLQCARRFCESNFLQIFSKKGKINLLHYVASYLHYFCIVLALLVNTEGFVRDSQPSSFSFAKISILQYICIFLFYVCWSQQYKSNMILVNLRKDSKSGQVVTEKHVLPTGGFFNYVSSPHMFFEIAMYVVLLGILEKSFTWKLIAFWVLCNQVISALLTHKWYKNNFKNYPKNRKALIPFIF